MISFAVIAYRPAVELCLDSFQNLGNKLIVNYFLLLAQDGCLQQVVHLLVSGHLQHCQNNQVPEPVLGQPDDCHVCLVTGDCTDLLYEGCLGGVGTFLNSCDYLFK